MKVNKKFRYGLRGMIELATHYKHGPLAAKAISKSESIPLQYLEQIFNLLKKAGLVKTVRGSKGGYLVSREPSKIKVSHIMDALDAGSYLTDCLGPRPKGNCARVETCPAAKFWRKLDKNIERLAKSTSLKEMASKSPKDAGIRHNYMFQI